MRAERLHRREAKAARRRKRNANGKRRHSPHRGVQLAARLVQAQHNLENLGAMAGVKRKGFLAKFSKPKLLHIGASTVLPTSFTDRLLSGARA